MTLDEKLEQFYKAAIDSATSQNIQIINEYKQSLQQIYAEHKEEVLHKTELSYDIESNKLIREKNRNLSAETINIKRKISERSIELVNKLFEGVLDKLNKYMKSQDYEDLLVKQILEEKKFTGGEEVTIYINSSDLNLKTSLELKTEVALTISETDFIGGTRAVIHKQNVLIDNSFSTKLTEAKNTFTI